MVGKWEGVAERFREIEEAKWDKKESKGAKKEKSTVTPEDEIEHVTGQAKDDRVVAFLEKLKVRKKDED